MEQSECLQFGCKLWDSGVFVYCCMRKCVVSLYTQSWETLVQMLLCSQHTFTASFLLCEEKKHLRSLSPHLVFLHVLIPLRCCVHFCLCAVVVSWKWNHKFKRVRKKIATDIFFTGAADFLHFLKRCVCVCPENRFSWHQLAGCTEARNKVKRRFPLWKEREVLFVFFVVTGVQLVGWYAGRRVVCPINVIFKGKCFTKPYAT